MPTDRTRALELLQRHAVDPLSWQTLESPFRHWFGEHGYVGYVDTGGAWVAAGMPIGPAGSRPALARAFAAAAARARRRAVFFGAEPELLAELGGKALPIGLRPYWLPADWSLAEHRHASLRYQIRRAARHGVRIRRVPANELADPSSSLRQAIDGLSASWLNRRVLAPMGFIVSLELYLFPERHVYFVAECGARLVGVLSAVPVFSRNGWFIEDLLPRQRAPNGTNESLVSAFFAFARESGATYVTLGLEPLAGPLPWPLRIIRTLSQPLFDFAGLAHFKEKLRPHGHEFRYLGGAAGVPRWRALLDVLKAFAHGSLWRFALHTLVRGSVAVVTALTVLLLAWIPLLMVAKAPRWFPSPAIHRAWIGFDILLAAGLIALCRRYRPLLAVTLAIAVSADAVLTLIEAFTYNVPRMRGPTDAIWIAATCAGPLAGAAALWTVAAHQRRVI